MVKAFLLAELNRYGIYKTPRNVENPLFQWNIIFLIFPFFPCISPIPVQTKINRQNSLRCLTFAQFIPPIWPQNCAGMAPDKGSTKV
jgi:hypothetical protein